MRLYLVRCAICGSNSTEQKIDLESKVVFSVLGGGVIIIRCVCAHLLNINEKELLRFAKALLLTVFVD